RLWLGCRNIVAYFRPSLGMVMSSGGTLIERFVAQELDDSVRSILKDAFDENSLSHWCKRDRSCR
ncbi:hypothetical protein ACW9H6_29090, partial [Pseudomonas sp. SDO528_S397]